MPSTEPAIEARGIVKRFGKVTALDGLDLTVESGQVVAILGPNGAGKSTFVDLVATLLRPDAGTLRVHGYDVVRDAAQVRGVIGLAGQFAAVEPALTSRENLEMVARLMGLRRREARSESGRVLEELGLAEAADRPARTLSGGMRRKLDLGASLVGSPRLLLLDEPTTGLDPAARMDLWDAIRELAAQGTDVLLTTQYLDEADHLASRIAIIDHGRLIAEGSPAGLKRSIGRSTVEVHVRDRRHLAAVENVLRGSASGSATLDSAAMRVSVPVNDSAHRVLAALGPLEEAGVVLDAVSFRPPTLDEVFLALTGNTVEVAS